MSLVQLSETIEDNRAALVKAGIRGIDLDYLTDHRVEHRACDAQLQSVVAVELERWLQVRSSISEEQWAYFEATEEKNNETRALKKAARDLHDAFKKRVLVFFKEAERRTQDARDAARPKKKMDWPLSGVSGEQQ